MPLRYAVLAAVVTWPTGVVGRLTGAVLGARTTGEIPRHDRRTGPSRSAERGPPARSPASIFPFGGADMTGAVSGLIAAAIVFVVLFVILGVTLWVSIVAAVAALIILGALTGGVMHRTTTT
ncbi:MAG TPA: hypothetical protein VH418_21750 [Solirubrobacteraceae bacterium]